MTIDARPVDCGEMPFIQYSQPGVPTAYLLSPEVGAEVDKIRNETSRWRVIRDIATFRSKKRSGER